MTRVRDAHRARSSHEQRLAQHPGNLSLELVDRFLDVLRLEKGISEVTLREYRSHLRSAEVWLWRRVGRTLVSASSAHLTRYLRELQAKGQAASKSSGVARRFRNLRRFYGWLEAIGARDEDPTRDAQLVEWWTQQHSAGLAQRRRARRAAIRERNRLMFAVMLWSGLSAREVVSLRLSDLDLSECTLEPRGMLAGRVALTDSLSKLLASYIEGARNTILGGRESEYLFPSRSGEPLLESACSRTTQSLLGAFWPRIFPGDRSAPGLKLD
ncbi:MAG TPA: site-specific integrase [Steroidobacter sp.]